MLMRSNATRMQQSGEPLELARARCMLQGCHSVCSDKQLNTDLVVRPAGRAEQLRQLAPPGQQGV